MPTRWTTYILTAVWLAPLLVACRATHPASTGTPIPTPTQAAATIHTAAPLLSQPTARPALSIKPPPAHLEAAGSTQRARIASYCWREDDERLCADYEGIATAPDPLVIESPSMVNLRLPLTERPLAVQMALQSVTEADMLPFRSEDHQPWNVYPANGHRELALQPTQTVELRLDPGLYVIAVYVQWEPFRTVTYGFLIQVR
jgi:hypothetical protein